MGKRIPPADDYGDPAPASGDWQSWLGHALKRVLEPTGCVGDLDTPVMVVPDDHTVIGVEKFMDQPRRVRSTTQFTDVESFVAYCQLYGSEHSVVFAELSKRSAVAILDYHTRADTGDDPDPSWCSHSAVLTLRYSDDFEVWIKGDQRKMTQRGFVEFIEDTADDITDPDAATFLEIAKTLKVNMAASLSSHVSLDTGDMRFSFARESRGRSHRDDVDIPEVFEITVPVFEFGERVRMQARLRYRADEEGLVLFYKLKNPERIVRDLAAQVMMGIRDQVAARVLFGSHEHRRPDL